MPLNIQRWTKALLRILSREEPDNVGRLQSVIQDLLDEGFEHTSVGTIALVLDEVDSKD